MSTATRNMSGVFYWIGVATAVACFILILAGNTNLLWGLEHRGLPLSWAFGAGAVLAFLAAEYCGRTAASPASIEHERNAEAPRELTAAGL